MERQTAQKRGYNTSPARRRINCRYAQGRFIQLLEMNFPGRACLVTLSYAPDGYTPTEQLAHLDIKTWIQLVRKELTQPFRYVRLTEPAQGDRLRPVHRIVTDWTDAGTACFPMLWGYGPVSVEKLPSGQFAQLAEMLVWEDTECKRAVGPCKRAWSPSIGLWTGKEGAEHGKAQKDDYGRADCQNHPVYRPGA